MRARRNVWKGQHGSVILGPTEDRVARYLHDLTRHGLVTVRTVDLASRLQLERSEAYRVLARLRALGLFGVANDQGGTRGGRRIWRTDEARQVCGLDRGRHRVAWARVVAWGTARRARALATLHSIRRAASATLAVAATPTAGLVPPGPAVGGTFADLFRKGGGGELLDAWGVT